MLLLVTAAGLLLAALFTTDPLTAAKGSRTAHGKLHELGATLDAIPFAAAFLSWSLARRNEAWESARRWLFWRTVLVWAGEVVFLATLAATFPKDGRFGPDVPIGWPGRFVLLTHCVWLMTVAWQALRLPARDAGGSESEHASQPPHAVADLRRARPAESEDESLA